jgi:hypothetical protein
MVGDAGGACGLTGAFAEHARLKPEEPWLFVQQGWDWRWRAFGELAEWVGATVEAVSDLAPQTRVGYAARLSPALIAADLALQAAGLAAVPIDPDLGSAERRETARRRRCGAWLELGTEEAGEAPVALVRRAPSLESGAARSAATPGALGLALASLSARRPGGALAVAEGGPVEIEGGALGAAARSLAEAIGPARRQEITVLAGCLEEPLARYLLAWATASGAAVVLEPDRRAYLATAAWARPTVLGGGAADLEAALARAEAGSTGRRSPFGRLRAWLVAAGEPIPEKLSERWQRRAVRILPLPPPR